MTSSSFGKFVVGALVGGAIGGVIGMLLAPRSGSETRALIREEMETRRRDVADAVRERSDLLKEKASVIRDKVSDLSAELEEAGRSAVSRMTGRETPSA